MRKRKCVFGPRRRVRIAYEPIPWSAQGDPKIEEKKGHISEAIFLGEIYKKYENMAPKSLQKGDPETGKTHLGAVLGHVWCPKQFSDLKNEPIASPKCFQGRKITQKITPKVNTYSKNVKKGPPSVLFSLIFVVRTSEAQYRILRDLQPGPADCAKRFE